MYNCFLNKPKFSRYDLEGKEWIMEGFGLDIFVDNDPAKKFVEIFNLTTLSMKIPLAFFIIIFHIYKEFGSLKYQKSY